MTEVKEKPKSVFVHVCRHAASGRCKKETCYHYPDHLIEPECKTACSVKTSEPRCLTIRTGGNHVEL